MKLTHPVPLFMLLASGMALAPAEGAMAADEPDLPQTKVRIDDLDLSTAMGAERMDQRIRRAAAYVCDDGFGTRGPKIDLCVQQAIEEARGQRDAALVHAQRGQLARLQTAWGGKICKALTIEGRGVRSFVRR